MALEACEVERDARRQLDTHCTASTGIYAADLVATPNDAFGEEVSNRELGVVTRRSHRHRDCSRNSAIGARHADLVVVVRRQTAERHPAVVTSTRELTREPVSRREGRVCENAQ